MFDCGISPLTFYILLFKPLSDYASRTVNPQGFRPIRYEDKYCLDRDLPKADPAGGAADPPHNDADDDDDDDDGKGCTRGVKVKS